MQNLKFGVVVFPGSNCDDDLVHVLSEVCKVKVKKIFVTTKKKKKRKKKKKKRKK